MWYMYGMEHESLEGSSGTGCSVDGSEDCAE